MALPRLLIVAASLVLANCALTAGIRDDVIAGYCGVERGEAWTLTDAPSDADAYRRLAIDTHRANGRFPEEEFWFSNGEGGGRYCRTPLRRATHFAERNGSGCDDRIGRWWDFRRTEAGLVTEGVEERICIL